MDIGIAMQPSAYNQNPLKLQSKSECTAIIGELSERAQTC